MRAVFGVDSCCLFPQCMPATVPLIGGVTGVVAARACPGYWSGLPPCSVVVAALLGAGSVLSLLE